MKLATASFQVHRWVGLAFGLFGVMWFASVIFMALFPYWDRPLPSTMLRAYGPPLTAADVAPLPNIPDRTAEGEPVRTALLHRIDKDLVWQLDVAKRGTVVISAGTGKLRNVMTRDEAVNMARLVVGDNATPRQVGQFDGVDIFSTSARTPNGTPYRVSFDDRNSTDVFLDPVTGEVQRVLGTRERVYRIGRMPHLGYMPPFDFRDDLRDPMRGAALTGLFMATLAGFVYGMGFVLRSRRGSGRRRVATLHLWLGLVVFPVILLWEASGFVMLLSGSTIGPTAKELAPLRGKPIRAAEFKVTPSEALRVASKLDAQPIMALQAGRFLDMPVYEALHEDGHVTMVEGGSGQVLSPLSEKYVREVAQRFAGANAVATRVEQITNYDIYYYKLKRSDPLPLPVFRVMLTSQDGGAIPTRVYVDAYSGEVRGRVDRAQQIDRWFGRLPHTFDFPWMLKHPNVRIAAVAIPGVAATVLAIAGLWLGVLFLLRFLPWRKRATQRETADVT